MASHIEVEPQTGKRYAYLMMEVDEFPDWRFTLRLDDLEGKLVPAELRITAKSVETVIDSKTTSSTLGFESDGVLPEAGLSTTLLRKVALDRLVKRGLAGIGSEWAELPWNDWLSTDRSRVGRGGRSDRFYAEWAASYVRFITRGEPNPVIRLAEKECLSVSQVRTILGEARRRNLLSEAPRGRAGGYLTSLAESILSKPPMPEEH
ncbi:MAG: hypothetical protein GWP47_15440 [Actinobacteria bacterium]|nr:hypothetical protein [Actinomycetota bacterium]